MAELAGLVPRGLAYSIDLMIKAGISLLAFLLLTWFGEAGVGVFLIFYFLLEWFYPVFFELFRNGQTIGKRAMKLRVVHDDLTPIGLSSSLTRNLLRVADYLPGLFVVGGISMVVTQRLQRLGDLAAKTVVIYTDAVRVNSDVLPSEAPVAPAYAMSVEQERAVIAYALNQRLSEPRKLELAEILQPLFVTIGTPDQLAAHLRGLGKWFLGERV